MQSSRPELRPAMRSSNAANTTLSVGELRQPMPQPLRGSGQVTDLLAVFRGDAPVDGVAIGPAELLWWAGDVEQAVAVSGGAIGLLDEVIPLVGADGAPGWMLMRRRPALPHGGALVVEDDEINREFYGVVLAQIGLDVHLAASAAEALEIARSHPLSLAIVDVRLPDANGFELCRSLVAERSMQDCAMLIMSADPLSADYERIEAVGAVGFMLNPVDPVELARRVAQVLAHSAGAPTTGHPTRQAVRPTQPASRLSFFGRPTISVNGVSTPLRPGQSTVLLAALATACPAPVSSERLGRFGWPTEAEVSPNAVYTAVSRLRHVLSESGAPDLLLSDGSGYSLNLEPMNIDLVRFEAEARSLLTAADNGLEDALANIARVLGLWTGEPFVGTRNEVLTRWGNRLAESRSRLLEMQSVMLVLAGNARAAAEVCRDLLIQEPWREFMWATLIVALYRSGRSRDALTAFGQARKRLQDELGLDPGPLLTDLEMMILIHDPALRDDDWLRRLAVGSPFSAGDL